MNAVALVVLCLLTTVTASDDIKERGYKIRKGDTLWDISSKKLKSPYLWPKLWKENPQIRNPDLIYPGQTLHIFGDRQAAAEEAARKSPEVEVVPEKGRVIVPKKLDSFEIKIEQRKNLISRGALINSGYIADLVPVEGRIKGDTLSDRSLLAVSNTVYLSLHRVPAPKTRFYAVSIPEPLIHPVTGETLGYFSRIKGVLEVVGLDNGNITAVIKESFEEIGINDYLASYYEIEVPSSGLEVRRPAIAGTVVKMRDGNAVGRRGIVYIDRGVTDGIKIGDMFSVINSDAPNVSIGAILVVSAGEKFSVALVENAIKEVKVGDSFKN